MTRKNTWYIYKKQICNMHCKLCIAWGAPGQPSCTHLLTKLICQNPGHGTEKSIDPQYRSWWIMGYDCSRFMSTSSLIMTHDTSLSMTNYDPYSSWPTIPHRDHVVVVCMVNICWSMVSQSWAIIYIKCLSSHTSRLELYVSSSMATGCSP